MDYFDDVVALNPISFLSSNQSIGEVLGLTEFLWQALLEKGSWECPFCGAKVTAYLSGEESERIYEQFLGKSVLLTAAIDLPEDRELIFKAGFSYLFEDNELVAADSETSAQSKKSLVVLDRFILNEKAKKRLTEALSTASMLGFSEGRAYSFSESGKIKDELDIRFRECCPQCGERQSRGEIRKQYLKSFSKRVSP